jgi:hypothetical protein
MKVESALESASVLVLESASVLVLEGVSTPVIAPRDDPTDEM